jgi:hypothetical protein
MSTGENTYDLERERMDLERQRILLEQERLKVDRFKSWWTGISILIPLLVAAVTVAFNTWSQVQQAQSEFELKAAEIVMNASGPAEARNKARALAALFPDRLSENFAGFAEAFDPDLYGGPDAEVKKELLRWIIANPEQKQEIVEMWVEVFPDDEWANDLLE